MSELPFSFHTSVNSARSNPSIEAAHPGDASEPWSLPWHALQRTVARGVGVEAASYSPPGHRSPNARFKTAEAVSWLKRARIGAPQPAAPLPQRERRRPPPPPAG